MRPRARQKRSEITRRRIREAAAIEFASRGYEGASLRSIARACDVELALVQYHFGDKLAVWSAVLDDVLGRHIEEIEDATARVADRYPSDVVAAFIEALIRRAACDPLLVAILSHARLVRGPESVAVHDRVRASARRIISVIAAAQAEGAVIGGDPGLVFFLMVGAAMQVYTSSVDSEEIIGRSPKDPTLLEDHVRAAVRAFIPGRVDLARCVPPPDAPRVRRGGRQVPHRRKARTPRPRNQAMGLIQS